MASNEKIIQQIITDLGSTNDDTVLDAITKARQKGNQMVVEPIVKLLSHKNDQIKVAAKNTLFDLKDVNAVPALLDVFDQISDKEIRNLILQSLWQSNIQPAQVVSRLVKIAVQGSLEECIEVYSIITNIIDVAIPDEEITEAILIANNAIQNIKDSHQKQLVMDIVTFLNNNE